MVEISEDLAQKLLNYLSRLPYREVAELIGKLGQAIQPKDSSGENPDG